MGEFCTLLLLEPISRWRDWATLLSVHLGGSMKVGMGPRMSRSLCNLTAPLVRRKRAQGNQQRSPIAGMPIPDSARFKIAFVGSFVPAADVLTYPGFSTAAGLFQKNMLQGLRNSGLDVSTIFSVRPVPSFPRYRQLWFGSRAFNPDGESSSGFYLAFVNCGPLKTLTLGLDLFRQLLRWGWKERRYSKVIVLYNVENPPGLVSFLAARLLRSKVVAVVADIEVPGSGGRPNGILRRLSFSLQTQTLPLFDGLVSLTRNVVTDFAPNSRHIFLSGGVSDELVTRFSESNVQDVEPPIVVMYSGELSEMRGLPLVIDAFRLVSDARYSLWITGRGPLENLARRAAQVDNRIKYWGYLDYSDVLSLYRRAAMLVNPHSTQAKTARYVFPSKLIEYLATGRPVITTRLPDIEPFAEHVFLLRDESPAALADLILHVGSLLPSTRDSFGQRARGHLLRSMTWDRQGARLADFLVRVATGSGPSDEHLM